MHVIPHKASTQSSMAVVTSSFSFIILTCAFFQCFSLSIASYQYFQFVQQWPPNFCYGRNPPCNNRPSFTIHGLWPSNFSQNNYNHNCSAGSIFDNQMYSNQTLVNDLTRSWPELKSGNHRRFWREQWDKHGKCSDQTYRQTRYFQRAFEMWNQYDITSIFRTAGVISPPGTPPRQCNARDLETRIEALTHRTPVLRCRRATVPNVPQAVLLIFEVGICYNYDGTNLIDCNRTQGRCTGNNIYF